MEVSVKLHTPVPHPQEGAADSNRMGGCVGPTASLAIWRDKFHTTPETEQFLRHIVINCATLATEIMVDF